jgi:hypothetical protein
VELELQEVGQKHRELKEVLWPEGIEKWEVESAASRRRVRRQLTSALGEKAMGKEASTDFFLLIGGEERERGWSRSRTSAADGRCSPVRRQQWRRRRAHVPRPGAADRWGRRRV